MDLLLKSPKEGTLLGMQFHGTKLFQVFGLLMSQGRAQSSAGVQEELPLTIGATLVLAVVLFFVLVINRNEWKLKERLFGCIIELFIYGMIAVCITTCYFPWDDLAKYNNVITRCLISVQVPFRYLSIATVFLTFVLIYALYILSEKYRIMPSRIIMAICMISAWVIAEFYVGYCFSNDTVYQAEYDTEYYADNLYLLKETDYSMSVLWDSSIDTYGENISVERLGTDDKNQKMYYIKNADEHAQKIDLE